MPTGRSLVVLAFTGVLAACSSSPPFPVERSVDLGRFMGDWYVIANIPIPMEKDAHNAVES